MKRLKAIMMYRLFGIMPKGRTNEYIQKYVVKLAQKESNKRQLLSRSVYLTSKIQ